MKKIRRKAIYKTVCATLVGLAFGTISIGCSGPAPQNNAQVVKQNNEVDVVQPSSEPVVVEEKVVNPKDVDWDMSHVYIQESDNFQKTVDVLHRMTETDFETQSVMDIDIGTATKKPWEYYGQFVRVMGHVAYVQAYPPKSELSKLLGYDGVTTEIVIVSGEGSGYADYYFMGDASDIAVDSFVRIKGLPCGLVDAPNIMGGSNTYFVMIGDEQPEVIY